jgi:hypothetical protein
MRGILQGLGVTLSHLMRPKVRSTIVQALLLPDASIS